MTLVLSPNTQAILLLTAPLIAGRGTVSSELLSSGEYRRLARQLREIHRQPADLVAPDAVEILRACKPVIPESRMQRLLGRGFLLSQVIEHWQARAIWVVSRADAEYPRRLKARLREDAPAVLYGCGDIGLLETGGLAVVGSRHVDEALIDYTMSIGRLAAHAGRTVVSGGAKGVDQAAMRGAIEAGGKVCGVLADSLEKSTLNRENRNLLLDCQLVLISPYDPGAGFNVGNAMQRNKLIYALADTSLVVNSDLNKGGTWAGAVEQLDKLKLVPVFVRSTGASTPGLDALQRKGALPWPNPRDSDALAEVFNVQRGSATPTVQVDLSLPSNGGPPASDAASTSRVAPHAASVQTEGKQSAPVGVPSGPTQPSAASSESSLASGEVAAQVGEAPHPPPLESTPAVVLFAAARAAILRLLTVPMKDVEVAAALDVSSAQAKAWLQRLATGAEVEKLSRPVRYVASSQESLLAPKVVKNRSRGQEVAAAEPSGRIRRAV